MRGSKKTKIDPELTRQIDSIGASNDSIEAVFSLDLPMKKLLDPTTVEKTTHQVLKRVEEEVGSKPTVVNVFENLGSFAVSAEAPFIQRIIDDPEIATAVANNQPEPESNHKTK